uniref:Potassium channel toxin alpha-KTx 18.1 n=1 Tax=Tityus obscurus TaxID=1221240 RepID=KA181_TITOB|nr:RecName: Full=Potassium channel toxin alpha-KTx 18.1; AltName: Full=Toxin Tc32; AltName: Full=Toxin To32; Flags: Precursor [Tityus obscurus]WDU65864.1 putative KTx Tcis19 [Tityus cisandinus]
MRFTGIILILISMTLIDSFFEMKVEATGPQTTCQAAMCEAGCKGLGKSMESCQGDTCKCKA